MPTPGWLGGAVGLTAKEYFFDRHVPWYVGTGTDVALGFAAAHDRTAWLVRGASHRLGVGTIRAGRAAGHLALRSRGALALRGGLTRAGAVAAPYAAAAALGYVGGAVVGTRLARAMDGDRGAAAALDLYTGQVSWDKYWATVREGLGTL